MNFVIKGFQKWYLSIINNFIKKGGTGVFILIINTRKIYMNESFITRRNLLILIIVVIIILIITSIILYCIRGKSTHNIDEKEQGENFINTYGKSENDEIDQQAYFDINFCISQYLSTININSSNYYSYDKSGSYKKIEENEIKQQIYYLLSKKYIDQNNITIENVYDYVHTLDTASLFVPLEMSLLQDSNIKGFVVHGLVESLDFKVIDEIFVVVNIDKANNKFSIQPIYGDYKKIEEIKNLHIEDIIDNNDNNKFTTSTVTYEDVAKNYINIYKRLAIGDPDLAYEYIDKEYREKRFGSIDKFKKYVKENKDKIKSISLEQYQVIEEEGYKQYVCIDKNEFYYIFKESNIMDFTVITDTYTVDIPRFSKFTKTYDESSEKEKVIMNIDKVIEALNTKDYEYVYNKLSKGFKNNYFKTQEDFNEFAKKYFKNNNKVNYNNYSKEGNTHICNITLTDKAEKSTLELNTDILMRLQDGTDFVFTMSGIVPDVVYNGN